MKNKNDKKNNFKFFVSLKNRNEGQMIVLMGFFLLVAVVVLASISADLSSIGTEVPQRHSKALLPDFISIKDKFLVGFDVNLDTIIYKKEANEEKKDNKYQDYTFDEIMSESFNITLNSFAALSIKQGNYFDAELIDYGYGGSVVLSSGETAAVYNVKARLLLNDGKSRLSQNVSYLVTVS